MGEDRQQLMAGCLFSGMGGFASGLVKAGFAIQWATDNDKFACEAFRHRFPDVRLIEKDIQSVSVQGDRLAEVDILAAGFPCQSFSQAGSRRGFEDPRGKLFFEIPRLLSEFCPEQRPRLVVLENVPNVLYGSEGIWFDEIRRVLRRAGYWFRKESCWTVNVKDATNLPQDRERLFMVAASRQHFSFNPFGSSAVARPVNGTRCDIQEFIDRDRHGASEAYLPPNNRYYKMIDREIATGESEANLYQLRRSYVREKKDGLCPTLTANMGIGGHNVPFIRDTWGIRKLSVEEVARLQGFDTVESLFPTIPVRAIPAAGKCSMRCLGQPGRERVCGDSKRRRQPMTSDIGWRFPPTNGGRVDGFNDPGIAYFTGSPLSSLARETLQNSLDARGTLGLPVHASFELIDLPPEDIGRDELSEAIVACSQTAQGDPMAERGLQVAGELIGENQYPACACLTATPPVCEGNSGVRWLRCRG